jgi:hypothetical protein
LSLITLATLTNLATAYRNYGRSERSVSLFEEALARRRAVQSPDHHDTLAALRGYPGSYAAFCCGYLNRSIDRFSPGASRRNIPRVELIRTHAALDSGVRS